MAGPEGGRSSISTDGIRSGRINRRGYRRLALLGGAGLLPLITHGCRKDTSLLGCGLRRSEVAALTVGHVQQRDGRWCIVDLVGKHGRVRTIPMPTWVKVAQDAWTSGAGVVDGYVFRPVDRAGQAQGVCLSEKVVWQLLQPYAAAAGVPGIAPHDCRRTCAKLCRAAGGELEQIQLLLGHASVQTTERYLGTKQDLVHAPNDGIKLRVAV